MKRKILFLVFLLILLSISGCKSIFHIELGSHPDQDDKPTNNGLNVKNLPVEQSPIELGLVSGEYRAIWKENYKYDTPILINDLDDLEEFLSNHPQQSASEDMLQQYYDDEFFSQNVIYVYVKSEISGSIKLNVKSAELNGDILKLFMEHKVPEGMDDDMATRVCLFGINRNDIKNVKTMEGIILNRTSE